MDWSERYIIILPIIFIFAITIIVFLVHYLSASLKKTKENQCIYCLMITGKDASREQYAKRSILNFKDQDYENKKLVIINHGPYTLLPSPDPHDSADFPNIFEFKIEKKTTSLGNLRNISLNMVPIDSMWTPWDDDDFRSTNYLTYLSSVMIQNNADIVSLTRRVEYNKLNGYVWQMQQTLGLPMMLVKQDLRIQYIDVDTMEDVRILTDAEILGKKVYRDIQNDPFIYIRTVHGSNTSLYVNKEKRSVKTVPQSQFTAGYNEFEVTEQQTNMIRKLMFQDTDSSVNFLSM